MTYLAVLVAQRVVEVEHPYLGDDVEIRLWSPLDDVEDLKAVRASHSASVVVGATANSDAPVIYHVIKPQPVNPVCSLPDSNRSDDHFQKKPSVENVQSQTCVEAVSTRQMTSRLTSDADNRHLKCLPIDVDCEDQFQLLKQMLEKGLARDHQCTFSSDVSSWTITLKSKREECVRLLAEQMYGFKKGGTFEVEVQLPQGLAQLLYSGHRQWLCDRLHKNMSEPALLKMSDGCLAVAAFSQNTASQGAKMLKSCLLRGKVPIADHQRKFVNSAKYHKKINDIMTNKAITVVTGDRKITVDGFPHDVICAVGEIDQCLYK